MKNNWIMIALLGMVVIGASYLSGEDSGPGEIVAFQMGEVQEPVPEASGDATDGFGAITDELRPEFEQLIRSYILEHPELIAEALEVLQLRQQQAELDAAADAIEELAGPLFRSERDIVLGNPDGDMTLVEFYDYNCTFCRRAMADIERLLDADPDLRLVMKEFPILGEGSVEAARVSVAVARAFPEAFEEFHFALMSEQGQVDGNVALSIAEEIGLDVEALLPVLDSDEVVATINDVYRLAEPLNLTGTPSFVTPREVIVGAVGFEALREKIAAARASE